MAVIYYQYLELNESGSISSFWKGLQILIYVVGALASFAASFTFGTFYHNYCDNYCILYSSVTFIKDSDVISNLNIDTSISPDSNSSTPSIVILPLGSIDLRNTIWEKSKTCDFCLYAIVFSFITCFIWATFFTMCGKGGRAFGGLPAAWRIVFPAMIMNVSYFIISVVVVVYMSHGYDTFCVYFMRNMKEDSCEDLYHYDKSEKKRAFLFLRYSLLFSWILGVAWLLSIFTLILRCLCVPDFDLLSIQMGEPTPNHRKALKMNLNGDLESAANVPTTSKSDVDQSTSRTQNNHAQEKDVIVTLS